MSTPRRRRAIIHIGTGKTGSTSIQALLAANRDRMIAQGFAYPVSAGVTNHLKLAVFAAEEKRADHIMRVVHRLGHGDAPISSASMLRRRLAAELGREIDALPDAVHTVIFSCEHLSSKATSAENVGRLKALLDTWFDDYRILVYLRRQDGYEVSLYSTLLRAGKTGFAILPPAAGVAARERRDWAGLLDCWGAAFGRAALLPRIFERVSFVEGDLLADMCAACGLAPLPPPRAEEAPASGNPSLTSAAQEFLRRMNLAARTGAGIGEDLGEDEDPVEAPGRGPDTMPADATDDAAEETGRASVFIRHFLITRFAGPGRRPSRADAEAFVARHAAGNDRIRAEFFPNRPSLFSTDFSRYPEVSDPPPTDEAILEVAIAVLQAQTADHNRTLADMLVRLGRQQEAAAPAEARTLYRRALAKLATQSQALRGLVRLAQDPTTQDEAEARLLRALSLEPEREELLALLRLVRRQAAERRHAAAPGAAPGNPPAPGPRRVRRVRQDS